MGWVCRSEVKIHALNANFTRVSIVNISAFYEWTNYLVHGVSESRVRKRTRNSVAVELGVRLQQKKTLKKVRSAWVELFGWFQGVSGELN